MPRTLSFPAPSPSTCPVCGGGLTGSRCPWCPAELGSSEGSKLWAIDHELHRLSAARNDLVGRVLARAAAPAAPPPAGLTQNAPLVAGDGPPRPPASLSPVGRASGRGAGVGPPTASVRGPSVPEVLVGLGALSLVAAVVVFAAVTWERLAAWTQGGLLLGATGLVLAVAVACRRRDLVSTSEALAAVAAVLAVADVRVAQVGLAAVASPRLVWAVGLALVAAGATTVGRRAALRSLTVSGVALGFVPGVVAAAGAGPVTLLLIVLTVQALVAAALTGPTAGRSLELAVVRAGALVSWVAAVSVTLLAVVVSGASSVAGLSAEPAAGPIVVLAALAAGSVIVGRRTSSALLAMAGAGVAFLPAVLAAALSTGSVEVVVWTMTAQAALAAGVEVLLVGRRAERAAVRFGGVVSGLGAAAGAALLGTDGLWTGTGAVESSAVLVSLAVVAAAASLAASGLGPARADGGGWSRPTVGVGLGGAVAALLAAVALAGATSSAAVALAAVALAAGALTLGAALLASRDGIRPWTAAAVTAGTVVALLAAVPLAAALVAALALVDVSAPPRAGTMGQAVSDRLALADAVPARWLPTVNVLGPLVGALLGCAAGAVLRRRWTAAAISATVVTGLLCVPAALGLGVGTTVTVLAVGLVAVGGWLLVRPDQLAVVAPGLAMAAVATALALGVPALAVTVTGLSALLGLALAGRAVVTGFAAAPAWLGGALAVAVSSAALDAWLLGLGGSGPALVLAGAAAVAAGAAPAAEHIGRRSTSPVAGAVDASPRTTAAATADAVVVAALAVAAVAVASLDALSLVVALATVVAGASALRPTRRGLWMVAVAGAVVLTWLRLGQADVSAVEAYSVPLAAGLLLVGLISARDAVRTSWERVGAALVAAVGPTTVVALIDVDVARTVAAVALGVALVIWGATGRQQAPLAVGAVAVAALAVRHLGPVTAELPRYLVFAVAGIVLVAAGATFEQRRRDLRQVRRSFAQLG